MAKSNLDTSPVLTPSKPMKRWKVIIHNDDKNTFDHVINTLMELAALKKQDAEIKTKEVHEEGLSIVLITHKERAELYKEQFESKSLTCTIEEE